MEITQHAWVRSDETIVTGVTAGDTVTSFHGEEWTFVAVSRPAQGSSTGRVRVRRDCPDCDHYWHTGDVEYAEFFPGVFDLYLGDQYGMEAV